MTWTSFSSSPSQLPPPAAAILRWDCKDRVKFLEDEYSFRCQCSDCLKVNFSDLVLNDFHCVKPNCSGIVLQSSVVDCEKGKLELLPNIITAGNMEPHLQAEEFINIDDIDRVAHHMQINSVFHINPGLCLKCCSYRDQESSSASANKAWISIRRYNSLKTGSDLSKFPMFNLHAAFCSIRELQPAMEHCKASIEIQEKLYNPNHIVIGYELVKLSSIQLSLSNCAARREKHTSSSLKDQQK
ncbi:hypothetical protein L3X38_014614 [Prunus dulcis]|uniref:Uncharacterized protein n=1 Tax=Prunus dulcis TaxID=3755 RepID=A0AAD4ZI50_PRUDU|nr:hypothetical protein L3X38_014614 [Prunus dulcis]